MRTTVTISLPSKLKTELDRLAKARETSRSTVMAEALRKYIQTEQLEYLRRVLGPAARRRGLFTDEDIFKIIS